MGFTLPLVNYHYVKRQCRYAVNYMMGAKSRQLRKQEKPVLAVNTTCAYCDERPTLPYHMGCIHIFCYYCLKGNMLADEQFECPQCQNSFSFAEPL